MNEISSYMQSCLKPKEIHRAIRGLKEIHNWKGTEFRTFLLYISIVVLKIHLRPIVYNHFLLFFVPLQFFPRTCMSNLF